MKTILRLIVAAFVLAAFNVSAATLYVSLTSPNPIPPYTNWATAAHIIQEAVDAAKAGDTVLVTNGVYDVGWRAPTGAWREGNNRVAITNSIRLESVSGPLLTTIMGQRRWTNAVGEVEGEGGRCVYLGTNAVLSGFTLTGGIARGGGGVFCESAAVVTNCILTSNSGGMDADGGGGFGGTFYNCTLSSNSVYGWNTHVSGSGAANSTLYNCTIAGHEVDAVSGCTLFNCVLSGNGGCGGGVFYNCTVVGNNGGIGGKAFNSIICGNTNGNYSGNAFLNHCLTTPLSTNGIGNIDADPRFVNAGAGDFRLRPDSPCIDAGTNLLGSPIEVWGYVEELGGWDWAIVGYITDPTDILGYPRGGDGNGDGKSGWDMGAYEYDPTVPIITQASITPAGLTIQWNATAIGAKLQRATSLTQPDWQDLLGSENTNRVVLPVWSGSEFFRLVKP